jgi:translation initiation factor 1
MTNRKHKSLTRSSAEEEGRIVYATGRGRVTPPKNEPAPRPGGGGVVRVGRQIQGRKGKGVTVVTGAPLAEPELAALGAELKRRCGSGGTVKAGIIEIQGDHRDVVVAELQKRGWTVRRSGG